MYLKAHWIGLISTAFLLGACFGTPKDQVSTQTTSDGQVSSQQVTSVTTSGGVDEAVIIPGSVDDFMLNVSDRVHFGYDRYDLDAEATSTLDSQVRWLKRFGNIDITIGGHADNRGTREYNLALSERRAQSVRDYMVGLGISPDRIRVVAYGKERPAVLGENEEAWAANRRAVTKITAN